jgi:UDP-N-acetylglucosamine 2-epimerase (non-hydrolysing)/GDP/UDP-N,N'-diacetylbacillosamine 2-epimerase (hydrolysing)
LRRGRQPTVSPYGDGEASRRIADGIAAIADFRALLQKGFYDIRTGGDAT